MAREWVQICVGLGFKELATESFSNNHAESDINPVECRRKFALQYLEKMINIEVPVPVLDESKARKLTVPDLKPVELSVYDKLHHKISRYLQSNWPMLAFIIMVALGAYLGLNHDLPMPKKPEPKETQLKELSVWPATDVEILSKQGSRLVLQLKQDATKVDKPTSNRGELEWVLQGDEESLKQGLQVHQFADGKAELLLRQVKAPSKAVDVEPVDDTGYKAPNDIKDDSKTAKAGFTPGAKNQITWPAKIPYFLMSLLVFAGVVLLFRKPDRIVEDSKPFQQALIIWQEWLLLRKQTPRTIKRFLNHLRYMAMRYRNDAPPRSLWQRWLTNSAKDKPQKPIFSEQALVALSVLHYLEPSWVADDEKFTKVNQQEFDELIKDLELDQESNISARDQILKQFKKTVVEHKTTFEVDVLATEEQRELFLNAVRK